MIVVAEFGKTNVGRARTKRVEGTFAFGLRQGEGDVRLGLTLVADVLHNHVNVDVGIRHDGKDLCGLARHVGHSDDRDLGLVEVSGNAGDDRLFHLLSLRGVVNDGSFVVSKRRANVQGHAVTTRVLGGADVQHLRPVGREFKHLFARNAMDLAREWNHARVGGEYSVDIGVNLTDIRVERRGECDGTCVGTATTECGDVTRVTVEALESGNNDDGSLGDGVFEATRGDVDDSGGAVLVIRNHARLAAGERSRVMAEATNGHGNECHRDSLARGQQHVQLAWGRHTRHFIREVNEFIGGVTHGAHHHHDVISGLACFDDAARDSLDALGVGDRRPAELLHNQAHLETLPHERNRGDGLNGPSILLTGKEAVRPCDVPRKLGRASPRRRIRGHRRRAVRTQDARP